MTRGRPSYWLEDWVTNWRDKASTRSDPDMDQLWAQLLAGKGFVLPENGQRARGHQRMDARMFRKVANFRVTLVSFTFDGSDGIVHTSEDADGRPRQSALVIINDKDSVYADAGGNFGSMPRLEWLGLVQSSQVMGFGEYAMPFNIDKFVPLECSGS